MIKKIIPVLLIFFLSPILWAYGNNTITLYTLSSSVSALSNLTRKTNKVGLIGKKLINKSFKDLFTSKALATLNPKINSRESALLTYDEKLNLYQLRSLQQGGRTCGAHAFKNSLWMLDGLSKDFEGFTESYLKILDQKSFDQYFATTTCRTKQDFDLSAQKQDLRVGNISCMINGDCLPKNSINLVQEIFNFTHVSSGTRSCPDSICEKWKQLFQCAQIALIKTEPNQDIEQIAREALMFYPGFNPRDITKLYSTLLNDNFCIAFELDSYSSITSHATCLVAHKLENNIEYLFLDSLNWPYTDNTYQFLDLIKNIKSIIENRLNFQHALIRRAYIFATYFALENLTFDFLIKPLEIFLDAKYKNLDLMKTKLYQSYKPHFCNYVTSCMKKDLEKKSMYEEILKQLNC